MEIFNGASLKVNRQQQYHISTIRNAIKCA